MPAPRTSLVRDDYIIVRVRRLFRYDGRLVGPHSLFRGLLPVRRELALALVENGDVRLPARVPKSALQ